jgi:3-oxoacyl-[acyl-carrier protein] reductase
MLNPMDMTGRRFMVTGASSGIGRETAVLLSELGATLVLVARDRNRLEETRLLLHGQSHRVEPYDLTSGDIPRWIKGISQDFGRLSGLAHCAGMMMTIPLLMVTSKHITDILDVNLSSALMLAKGLNLKGVFESPGGIVFLSSVMGLVGSPGCSLYSATKSALTGLTKSLALELACDHLRVNCVAPGFVDTPMFQKLNNILGAEKVATIELAHPMGIGRARDVAHAVAFLLADTGRWITGTTMVVDGGYSAQ